MEELVNFIVGESGFDSPEFLVRLLVVLIVCDFMAKLVNSMLRGVWK